MCLRDLANRRLVRPEKGPEAGCGTALAEGKCVGWLCSCAVCFCRERPGLPAINDESESHFAF